MPLLKQSNVLMPLEPALDREELRPASFSNVKGLQRHPVAMPSVDLRPQRLVTRDSLTFALARSLPAGPAGASLPDPPMTPPPGLAPEWPRERPTHEPDDDPLSPFLKPVDDRSVPGAPTPQQARPDAPITAKPGQKKKGPGEPLWHQLFSPEGEGGVRRKKDEPSKNPHYSRQITDSAFDWGEAGEISVDGLPESKSNIELLPGKNRKRIWFWQAIEGVFLSRAFSAALAVMMVVLFIGTIDVPWNEWMRRQASRVQEPISAAFEQMSRPIEERAAFFIADDFSTGLGHWADAESVTVDPAGWLKVTQGFAIHEETVDLQDYRLDFDAKIERRAVGWSVRTRDEDTFYGFKLLQEGAGESLAYSLSRFTVIDGVKSAVSQRIDVPAELARSDDFNRISVRVMNNQMTTLVNGWGVDFWRDDRIERGGVGLLADAGETALVRKMTVSGNDDTWGLILYGTLETMRSVEGFFTGDANAPATLLFYQPLMPTAPPAAYRLSGVEAR